MAKSDKLPFSDYIVEITRRHLLVSQLAKDVALELAPETGCAETEEPREVEASFGAVFNFPASVTGVFALQTETVPPASWSVVLKPERDVAWMSGALLVVADQFGDLVLATSDIRGPARLVLRTIVINAPNASPLLLPLPAQANFAIGSEIAIYEGCCFAEGSKRVGLKLRVQIEFYSNEGNSLGIVAFSYPIDQQ